MTRRRLYSGLAAGTLFLPACSSLSPQTAMLPYRPGTPVVTLPAGRPAMPPTVMPAEEQFASARPEATPMGVARNLARPLPGEMAPPPANPSQIETVLYREKAEEPLIITPRVHPAAGLSAPAPEPVTDAGGVIRPQWPVIRGPVPFIEAPADQPRKIFPPEPAPAEAVESKLVPSAVIMPPTPGSSGVIGTSLPSSETPVEPSREITIPAAASEKSVPAIPIPNHDKSSTSFILPTLPREEIPPAAPVVQPAPVAVAGPVLPAAATDTPLIQAVRAFQQNKPQEAMELLKSYDQPTQQVLISIMPVLVQLSEGKLQQMRREEMDLLLEQITRIPPMLRPRASLQATKLLLCREVHKFGHIDPFPAGNEFRPGDVVYLYAEIANFSCVPENGAGYSVALGSHLELLDAANAAVWKADPREEPEKVSSPPQDYYRAYRFCVPSSLPPGKYSLSIRLTDKPTGRETTKAIEFRVGAK